MGNGQGCEVPIGLHVVLVSLTDERFNGVEARITMRINSSLRIGVRITADTGIFLERAIKPINLMS